MKKFGTYFIDTNDTLGKGNFGYVYKCYSNYNKQGTALACKTISLKNVGYLIDIELKNYEKIKGKYVTNLIFAAKSKNNVYLISELCE